MRSSAMKSTVMAKRKVIYAKEETPLTFEHAIWLALHTPHKTHKQILEERKKEKLSKKNKK